MNNMAVNKGIIGGIGTITAYLMDSVNDIFIILAILMVLDYILGMTSAVVTGEQFSLKTALLGFLKKALYMVVLVLALLADYIVLHVLNNVLGAQIPFTAIFSVVATIYLLGTEGFSVCKHLAELGVPFPEPLMKFFGVMRDQAGSIAKIQNGGDGADEGGNENDQRN